MHLYNLWFVAIAVLWVGYFFLEGFDFGVGILTRVLAKSDTERRVLINTIGPVWDGNEVWLITAAGATFAAFPEWYASLFSGFYLPLLLILLALIVRGVAFEYRGKGDTDQALATLRPYLENPRYRAIVALHAGIITDLANRPAEAAANYQKAESELGELSRGNLSGVRSGQAFQHVGEDCTHGRSRNIALWNSPRWLSLLQSHATARIVSC